MAVSNVADETTGWTLLGLRLARAGRAGSLAGGPFAAASSKLGGWLDAPGLGGAEIPQRRASVFLGSVCVFSLWQVALPVLANLWRLPPRPEPAARARSECAPRPRPRP